MDDGPSRGRPWCLDEFTAFAETLADASREILLASGRQRPGVEVKDDLSPVTEIDRKIEDRLRQMITEAYPAHGIIGEERETSSPESDFVWVIDPIDGTFQFIAGIPVFGSLIALTRDGIPIIGVVDLPMTDDRWVGSEGRPTRHNGKQVPGRHCRELSAALLSTTTPDVFKNEELQTLERLKAATRWTVYGGGCLAYMLLLTGNIDVVIEVGLDAFDYCALVPVIEGAGGVITDWEGEALDLHSGSRILVSGGTLLHAEALNVVAQEP